MKKIITVTAIIMLVLFAVVIGSYFSIIKDSKILDDAVRSKLPGQFVNLKNGTICYQFHGLMNGELLVLVHGFSTPKFVFTKNVKAFTDAGYRVLTFDHFGRGYSDRPDALYDKDFFDNELLDFFQTLKIEKPFSIAGYSLGGGISAVFTSRHPEMVKKLILIAPVGFMDKAKGTNKLLMVPVLGEWLMAVVGRKIMIGQFQKEYEEGIASKEMVDLYSEQFGYKGYMDALLSTMRNYPMGSLLNEYIALSKKGKPVLVIWGTDDKTVPYGGSEKVIGAVPHAELVTIKGGGHSIVYSHPEVVNRSIVDFLRK